MQAMLWGALCAPNESGLLCTRAWLSALGPIIAIFALLLAFRQFSLSRQTTRRQLRAYVGIQEGLIQVGSLAGGTGNDILIIHITLKNSGQTPAYKFTTFFPAPLIRDVNETPFTRLRKARNAGSSVVFAQGDVTLRHRIKITPQELAAMRDNSKKVFIWGRADYTDTFGKRHVLRFHDINGDESGHGTGYWGLQPRGYQSS